MISILNAAYACRRVDEILIRRFASNQFHNFLRNQSQVRDGSSTSDPRWSDSAPKVAINLTNPRHQFRWIKFVIVKILDLSLIKID